MDPNQTLAILLNDNAELENRIAASYDLLEWLGKRGLAPDGCPTIAEIQSLQDSLLEDYADSQNLEVFEHDGNSEDGDCWSDWNDGEPAPAGWYYWSCCPGCLPDSDPIGPFATREGALEACWQDAQ